MKSQSVKSVKSADRIHLFSPTITHRYSAASADDANDAGIA
jgi:hypothetical protein